MDNGRLVDVGDTRLFVVERGHSGHFTFVEEQETYLDAVRRSLTA